MNETTKRLTMSVKELAREMGVSITNAYDLTHIKDFPVIVMGKRRIIVREKFEQWLAANTGKVVR